MQVDTAGTSLQARGPAFPNTNAAGTTAPAPCGLASTAPARQTLWTTWPRGACKTRAASACPSSKVRTGQLPRLQNHDVPAHSATLLPTDCIGYGYARTCDARFCRSIRCSSPLSLVCLV